MDRLSVGAPSAGGPPPPDPGNPPAHRAAPARAPDEFQREAVEHGEGPLLVVAGPGTGKTFVIEQRVLHLIGALGVRPDQILCLTFTEKAAEEMRRRIENALAGAHVQGMPVVSTFHAFCGDLLREFPVESDVPRDFRVLEGPRLLRFIMKRIDSFNLQHFRIRRSAIEFAQELDKFVSRCHDELLTSSAALARAKDFERAASSETDRQQARLWAEFAECKRMVEEELGDGRFLTFGDLISRSVRLLEDHPGIRAKLQARFRHLLVDEFQDDNFAQGRLVTLLAEPQGRVTVVGDDDQSIYRFRGAHPQILAEFETVWRPRGLRKVVLRQSYRSTPAIVAASSMLIARSPAHDREKVLVPAPGATGPPVRIVRTPDADRQAGYVAERVRLAQAHGVPLRQIAVLFRSMNHADALMRALGRGHLPAEVLGAGGLFDRREVRDTLAWASVVLNPLRDDLAAFRVLWTPELGIDPMDIARLTRAASDARKPLFEFVKDPTKVPDVSMEAKAALLALTRRLEAFQPEAQQLPAAEALARVIEFSGIRLRLDPDDPVGRRAAKNLALLLQLAEEVAADSDHPGLEEFVELTSLISKGPLDLPAAEPDLTEESVKVMTIHQAKGREFALVLVPDLIDKRFPPAVQAGLTEDFFVGLHHPETPRGARDDEERRLLYVAMTRAANALELLTFEAHESGRAAYPSPYLAELGYADGAPQGPLKSGIEVVEHAPLRRPSPTGPAVPVEADEEELVRGAVGILRGEPPANAAEAHAQLKGLVARWAAAFTTGPSPAGPVGQALADLAPVLGQIELPGPRDRVPVHHARPGVLQGVLDVSYSQLNTYERCPRQYMYGSVLNLRGRQSRQALAGNVIHTVLEQFYKSFKTARDATMDDLLGLYEAAFAAAAFENELERRQHYDDGLEMVKAFFEEERKRTTEPHLIEQWFEFTLGTVKVRGRVDRIDRHPDGRFEVIDYKTGRAESKKAYATENLQLPIYAMAMREHFKLPLKAATIYALKDKKRITLNVGEDLTEDAIERARRKILGIASDIRAGKFDPDPDPNKCPWCEFRMLCPASEAK
jgi:DNA helicase-2/ATP-dependent DNA helicase PcrA